jgi:hypothetical protein
MFIRPDNTPFVMLSSFCLTSFVKNTKVGLNHIVVVSKTNKYQGPLIDDYALNSCLFSKTVIC